MVAIIFSSTVDGNRPCSTGGGGVEYPPLFMGGGLPAIVLHVGEHSYYCSTYELRMKLLFCVCNIKQLTLCVGKTTFVHLQLYHIQEGENQN